MAVQTITVADNTFPNVEVITALPMANGDTTVPIQYPHFAGKTVQVVGTFGTLGSVNIEGSNDLTNWFVLTDPQGNALTKTAAFIEKIEENPLAIRGHVTAGDGTTALVLTLTAAKGVR